MKSQDTLAACEALACLRAARHRGRVRRRTASRTSGWCSATSPRTYADLRDAPDRAHRPGDRRSPRRRRSPACSTSAATRPALDEPAERDRRRARRVDLRVGPPARRDALEVHKLLMNLANSIEATVTPDPRVKDLVLQVRAEGEACYRAAGIDFASAEEDKERRGDRVHAATGERRIPRRRVVVAEPRPRDRIDREPTTSTARSRCSAGCTACPTPANELMQRVANEQARAGAAPKSVPVDSLLAQLP